ncbi:MAG: glycosyltransferase family 2 protein [Planctomycetes bacterium]|nr:glycosyltransferase family 2 protein [Planctomycetota bacterium]
MDTPAKARLELPADAFYSQAVRVELRGWVALPAPPREAVLLVDGDARMPLALDQERGDVARDLRCAPELARGFAGELELAGCRGRTVQLRVRAVDRDGRVVVSPAARVTIAPAAAPRLPHFVAGRLRLVLGSLLPLPGRATALALLRGLPADWRALARLGRTEPRFPPARLAQEPTRLLRDLTTGERAAFARELAGLPERPAATLLVPVLPGEEDAAENTLAALREQAYAPLALRAVSGRTPAELAAAAGAALAGESAVWLGFVPPGDRLHPAAVLRAIAALLAAPDADAVYTDEDEFVGPGRLAGAYRKPDWSPLLFLSQPYALRFALWRRELLLAAGGPNRAAGAAWEYDLALRVAPRARRILHLPELLHHRGGVEHDDPRARRAAVAAALAGFGLQGSVREARGFPGQELYLRPRGTPGVTVIVPTRDRPGLLGPCIASILRRTRYPGLELLIVDNGSVEPETHALLARWRTDPRVRVLRDERPFHFAALNNAAVRAARTPLVLLLNNDTEVVDPHWLDEMVALAELQDVGAVGARLRYADGTIQHAGVVLGFGGVAGHAHKRFAFAHPGYHGLAHSTREVSAVTGACLLTRRELWLELGGMDETFAVAFNDVDYCLRVRARGLRVVYTPRATLWHYESISRGRDRRGQERFEQERAAMRARWGAVLEQDPYFSPALARTASNYAEAVPASEAL